MRAHHLADNTQCLESNLYTLNVRCCSKPYDHIWSIWHQRIWSCPDSEHIHPDWNWIVSLPPTSDIYNNRLGTHSYLLSLQWIFIAAHRWPHHIFRLTFRPGNCFGSFQIGFWLIREIFGFWDRRSTQNFEPDLSNRVDWAGEPFWKKMQNISKSHYFEKWPCPKQWKHWKWQYL